MNDKEVVINAATKGIIRQVAKRRNKFPFHNPRRKVGATNNKSFRIFFDRFLFTGAVKRKNKCSFHGFSELVHLFCEKLVIEKVRLDRSVGSKGKATNEIYFVKSVFKVDEIKSTVTMMIESRCNL